MSTPLQTKSFQGLDGGMNQNNPIHEIPPTQARWMQDIILDTPGLIRRRGPVAPFSSSLGTALPNSTFPQHIIMAQDPGGIWRLCVMSTANTDKMLFNFWNGSGWTSYQPAASLQMGAYDPLANWTTLKHNFSVSAALDGSTIIGWSPLTGPDTVTSQRVNSGTFMWKGAIAATELTANLSANLNRGDGTLTLVSTAGIVPGHFVYAGTAYIGSVQSVAGPTVTLEQPSLGVLASGGALSFNPFRTNISQVGAGRITASTSSAGVTGVQGPLGTKFTSQLAVGSQLYRKSDGAYIGQVLTITDGATLTLVSNSLLNLTNEAYFAMVNTSTKLGANRDYKGYITAQYAGRQWWGSNTWSLSEVSKLYFSDLNLSDLIDFTADGTWLIVQSDGTHNSPINGLQAIPGGLVIFKENELWILRGTDISNFSLSKVADVGALHIGSIQPWRNGVIFAAKQGLYYYDGAHLQNMSPQLGAWWQDSINNSMKVNGTTAQAYFKPFVSSVITRGMYLATVTGFDSVTQIQKGSTTVSPNGNNTYMQTFCVNLDTGSITLMSNSFFYHAIDPPPQTGFTTMALVRDALTNQNYLVDLTQYFNGTGTDTLKTVFNNALGPDFYLETGRMDLGDPERKKLFKQLAMQYKLLGSTIQMDTIPGLQNIGTPTVQPWLTQPDWFNVRKKFTKRSTHLGFRFYQSDSNVIDFQIGPWALGFKLQRTGRV